MPREHGDDGAFVETVALDDVLGVFDAVDGPVILSADIADALDCSRETARRKLKELYDRGDLDRRKVSRRVIYWEPEEGRRREPTDAARADTVADATDAPADPPTDAHAGHALREDDATDTLLTELRRHLDAVDAPPKTEHGRDAVVDVVRHLREHGPMKTAALKEALYAEYGEHYGSDRAMWESLRRYLEDTPGVDTDAGYGKYGYAGDDDVREALKS